MYGIRADDDKAVRAVCTFQDGERDCRLSRNCSRFVVTCCERDGEFLSPPYRAYIYSGSREQKRLINSRDGIHLFDRFESVYIFREQRGDGATSIVFGRNILQEYTGNRL